MKNLMIYGTKYGFTTECMNQLIARLEGETTLINIKTDRVPSLAGYDKVILGGSVYMGTVQKEIKEYAASHTAELSAKKVGLFLCCGLAENFQAYLTNSFPALLLSNAGAKEVFGGVLNTGKMGFLDKMITSMMKKATEKENKPLPRPLPENITRFAEIMNG
ncbi:MAG: hypothetical protein BGN88_13000 [Clostridiales bacterium 43-6]|nr:MAG: hypothetical protein BGN88_13000 [Clostridiales bacterium 43-6]